MNDRTTPTVTVIMPTYNRAATIERAIMSILNQSYRDFELIIVDDGSTDNTEEVVARIEDDRIRYIKLEKNSGAPSARNRGVNESCGEFIVFEDSDDELLPDKLQEFVAELQNAPHTTGVVYSSYWYVDRNGKKEVKPEKHIQPKEGNIYKRLLLDNFVPINGLIRKSVLKEVKGFDQNLPRFQDWDLWLRIAVNYEFKYINKPLHIAYFSKNSITADDRKAITALEIIIDKYYPVFKENKSCLAEQYYKLGQCYTATGNLRQGREYFSKAISLSPQNGKYFIRFFLSLFGQGIYNSLKKTKQFIVNLKTKNIKKGREDAG
jgi:glycosyltransferase involved in cell wall biosynthesis